MHAQHLPDTNSPRKIASAHEIGEFLGELTLVIPCNNFSKVSSFQTLPNLGRVRVEMGIMVDNDFERVMPVPRDMSENLDYINFYLLTLSGLVKRLG
jgi:hypothetical protein